MSKYKHNFINRDRYRNNVPGMYYQTTGYYRRGGRFQRYTLQQSVHKSYAKRMNMPDYKGGVGGVFVVLVAIMLVATLFQSLAGGSPTLSMSGLLSYMSDAPQFASRSLMWFRDLTIQSDWGSLLNPLRDFINSFMSVLSVSVYLCVSLAQLLVYIAYFVGYLFGV